MSADQKFTATAEELMDLNKIPVLKMITTQMDWLNQRQKVISQNIANADTPDYVAHDLAPLDFADLARGQGTKLKMKYLNLTLTSLIGLNDYHFIGGIFITWLEEF